MKKLEKILVIDESRLVRATLAKHLKNDFDIREETNDESAWQTLVLDSSIRAVISSLHAPKLGAEGLLQRIRASPLRRLNELPFMLIASDTGKPPEYRAGDASGIAGFITKSMPRAEILKRLCAILDQSPDIAPQDLPEIRQEELAALVLPVENTPTLLSPDEIEQRLTHSLSSALSRSSGVCALMFGIVNHDALIDQFGEDVAEEIGARFAKLLLNKIGRHDCIARYAGERVVIISRGIDLEQCAHFAKRVCQSLAAGHITIRGDKVKLCATAGAATSLEDGIDTGKALLALASQRLNRALLCGGNAVVITNQPECPLHKAGLLLPKMLSVLSNNDERTIAAQIGTLGLQILPLLKVLNHELALGLELSEIQRQLQQRASAEQSANQGNQAA